MEKPEVSVVQANAQFPNDALLLVYSSIDGLQFRSSIGGIDKVSYNANAGRYEVLVKPVKQMMFVFKAGFKELKIATISPTSKDVFYCEVEESSSSDTRVKEFMERLSTPPRKTQSKLTLKSIDLKNYKYIIVNESKAWSRRYTLNWLRKAGYPGIDNRKAADVLSRVNPENTVYLNVSYKVEGYARGVATVDIVDHKGVAISSSEGTAPVSVTAVKIALEDLFAKNQKLEYIQTFSSGLIESNSADKLLDLKKLLDADVISREEYDSAALKLKNEILEKTE